VVATGGTNAMMMLMMAPRRFAAIAAMLTACGSARLVDVRQLEPGDTCAAGGVVVNTGEDSNGDGVLEPDEIESSEPICNGIDSQGALVDTALEPPGANCTDGGTRVRTGVDANNDGVLEDSEVQSTVYICNGGTGAPTLVSVLSEPPGGNCQFGGDVVRVGVDSNHDGTLEPSEVTSTSYVCTGSVPINEVINGDFYLRNSFDQALLVGVKQITGTLYVMPDPALTDPVAPALQQAYQVQIYKTCHAVSLPQLAHLNGLAVKPGASLTLLGAPALVDVGAGGIVVTPTALGSLDLSALGTVNGNVTFDAPTLNSLDLSSLTQVTGTLAFANTSLPTLSAPQLATTGALQLSTDGALKAVAFPALTSIGGPLVIDDFPQLASLDARSLATVQRLELRDLPLLSDAQSRFDALAQLPAGLVLDNVGWVTLQPLAALASCDVVHVSNLAQATNVDLPQLATVTSISITACTQLATLSGFANVTSLTSLTIAGNTSLINLPGFSALQGISSALTLEQNGLTTLDGFPALQNVTLLTIQFNSALTQLVGFPALVTADQIVINYNSPLTTVSGFQNLKTLTSTTGKGLTIQNQPNLTSIAMPQLISGSMFVDDSPLTTAAFPKLTDSSMGGGVVLWGSSLHDLTGFQAMQKGGLGIEGASELVSFSLPNLQTGGFAVRDAPNLTTIQMPSLLTAAFELQSLPSLTDFEAPLLHQVTDFSIIDVDALAELRFPAVQETEVFYISNAGSLELLEMPALTQIDNDTGLGIYITAFNLPACQIDELIAQANYTGESTYSASPPCQTIDRCRLVAPVDATIAANAAFDAVGQVRILGLTDLTSGIDASVVERFQVGYGPRGTSPVDPTWTWSTATPTSGWNDATAVGFDEYRGTLSLASGTYDVAARFSGDGGHTWTECDLDEGPGSDGSEDGYQISNAGHVGVP